MHISGAPAPRRDTRYTYAAAKSASVRTHESTEDNTNSRFNEVDQASLHDATVRDISASGVALNTAAKFDTNQFVELQMEDMPPIAGTVVRAYDGGVAIKFDETEANRMRMEHEVRKLNARA